MLTEGGKDATGRTPNDHSRVNATILYPCVLRIGSELSGCTLRTIRAPPSVSGGWPACENICPLPRRRIGNREVADQTGTDWVGIVFAGWQHYTMWLVHHCATLITSCAILYLCATTTLSTCAAQTVWISNRKSGSGDRYVHFRVWMHTFLEIVGSGSRSALCTLHSGRPIGLVCCACHCLIPLPISSREIYEYYRCLFDSLFEPQSPQHDSIGDCVYFSNHHHTQNRARWASALMVSGDCTQSSTLVIQVPGFIWHGLESRHPIIRQFIPVHFLSHVDMLLAQPFEYVDATLASLFIHTRHRHIHRIRRRPIPKGQT